MRLLVVSIERNEGRAIPSDVRLFEPRGQPSNYGPRLKNRPCQSVPPEVGPCEAIVEP